MRVFPLRYLPWMIRDLLAAQGALLVAVGFLAWLIVRQIDPPPPPSAGPGMVVMVMQQLALLYLLYCSAAIVSNDRVHGYYRGYFSRPLSPAGYYFLRWLLGGLIFILIAPVFTLALSLALGTFPFSWALLGNLSLSYLLLGSLVFLFSTFTRADWLFALMFLVIQSVLNGLRRGGVELSSIWDFVLTILPPFSLVSVSGPFPAGPNLVHVLLYGTGLVTLAILLLRWRPLGAGGRS